MKVLITGASSGIGRKAALEFLRKGHTVLGLDKNPPHSSCLVYDSFNPIVLDVRDRNKYEVLDEMVYDLDALVNNAGVQDDIDAIEVNLTSVIDFTRYVVSRSENLSDIVNIASTSAHNGAEFPRYSASKGGLLAYTKYLAQALGTRGVRVNSLSPGGVYTPINKHIMDDDKLHSAVLKETLLGKWATAEEIAEWIYFLVCVNKSMTGQDIIIDNGELSKFNFIW
jgi:NAD(P)-dependent dehydrogenase (short-subunit alcohol dehydrogenase family)